MDRHPERRRDLLERDDHRDAEREALDHRQWDEPDVATQAGKRHDQQQDACHEPDHEDSVSSVPRDDGDEDDRHRAGRSGDLQVAPAEDRRQDPGDDGGHQARPGPQPRRDPEGERQRQRHHSHRDPGQQVPAGKPTHLAQVVRAGHEVPDPIQQPGPDASGFLAPGG
ncbi:MAG: hypothetical protein U0R64_02140 [Candidatus Nanopelagicales bacterium]